MQNLALRRRASAKLQLVKAHSLKIALSRDFLEKFSDFNCCFSRFIGPVSVMLLSGFFG